MVSTRIATVSLLPSRWLVSAGTAMAHQCADRSGVAGRGVANQEVLHPSDPGRTMLVHPMMLRLIGEIGENSE